MRPLRGLFRKHKTVAVKQAEVDGDRPGDADGDHRRGPDSSPATTWCSPWARGPNFFGVPGAEEHAFPLYSADDAETLRNRILRLFEDADLDPARIDAGGAELRHRRRRGHRRRDGRRPRRPDPRRDAAALPRPARRARPRSTSSTSVDVVLGALLRQGPRVRGQGPPQEGRRAPARAGRSPRSQPTGSCSRDGTEIPTRTASSGPAA